MPRLGQEGSRYRVLLAVAGAVYLNWWFAVEKLMPGSFNPLASRLMVVAMLWALAWAGRIPLVERHMTAWFTAAVSVLTLHFHWLFANNTSHLLDWIVGEYITVMAVITCFGSLGVSRLYAVGVLAMAIAVSVVRPDVRGTIYLPGLVTILGLEEISQRTRIRLTERLWSSRLERENAERMSKARSDLLNLVSHELLTPLQAIELTVVGMERDDGSPEQQRRLARIRRSTTRLAELIHSLLEYARLGREELALEKSEVDLDRLVSAVVDELRPQAEAKQIALNCRVSGDGPIVSDARLVRMIVGNLVGNAVKYTQRGSVDVMIGQMDGFRRVQVKDTGRGIPPEAQQKIFEPFTQLEPVLHKHDPGVGMGLAIAKGLADRLGAQLQLTSELDRGSTFSLLLPTGGVGNPPTSTSAS